MSPDVAGWPGTLYRAGPGSTQMEPTDRVRFGKTSLTTTRLGLGSAPLGGLFNPVSDETAHGVVQHAHDAGLRSFDTAPLYGYGSAEQRMGHVLAQQPRDD